MKNLKISMHYGAIPILFEFAKELRLKQTDAELYLWNFLSSRFSQFHFRRQHPILFFIADFYCHKAKLIIEIDGGYHRLPIQYEYDQRRDKDLNELGLQVVRFTNDEVLGNIESVLIEIEKYLNLESKEDKMLFWGKTEPIPPLGARGSYGASLYLFSSLSFRILR